jgi:hypothetical protein
MNVYRQPDAVGLVTSSQNPMGCVGGNHDMVTPMQLLYLVSHLQAGIALQNADPLIVVLGTDFSDGQGRAEDALNGDAIVLQNALELLTGAFRHIGSEQVGKRHRESPVGYLSRHLSKVIDVVARSYQDGGCSQWLYAIERFDNLVGYLSA